MRRALRRVNIVVLIAAFGLFVWAVRDDSSPRWLPLAVLLLALGVTWAPQVGNRIRGGATTQPREATPVSSASAISAPVQLPTHLVKTVREHTARADAVWRAMVGLTGASGVAAVLWVALGPGDLAAAGAVGVLAVLILVLVWHSRNWLATAASRSVAMDLSRRVAGDLRFHPSASDMVVLVRTGSVESKRRILHLDEEGAVVLAAVGPPPPLEVPSFWIGTWHR